MNADGSGQTQLTFTESLTNAHPTWSPDGSMIAFSRSNLGMGVGGIWIMNADGSGSMQLTTGVVDDFPAWSPDGAKIAFRATGIGIAVMNADGTGVTPLTSTPSDAAPDWQPIVGPVFPAVDLSLTLTAKPKMVAKAGKSLVYTITVSNVGAEGASGVVVADDLDPGTTFVAATSTQGGCVPETLSSGATRVRCELGVLPGGDSAVVHVTVEPTRPKTTVSNTAFVSAINPDATVSNNSATVRTKVQ